MSAKSQVVTLIQPAFEPCSREEAKRWMSIDAADTAHDATVDLLVQAMREDAENLTHRAFIQRQYCLYLDRWPFDAYELPVQIELPFPPLVSVDSFKYRDLDGTLQTLAADQYVVHTWREPAIIVPAWQVAWPYIRSVPDAIQITFTAGYAAGSPSDEAASQEAIPAKLKLWMQAKAATLFAQREQLIVGNIVNAIPRDFTDALLDSLTVGTRLF